MVAVSLVGKIVSDIQTDATKTGIARTNFIIESGDADSRPLRFSATAIGVIGERAARLRKGGEAFFAGRMSAGGAAKINLFINNFEVIGKGSDAESHTGAY